VPVTLAVLPAVLGVLVLQRCVGAESKAMARIARDVRLVREALPQIA
jgi:hypothetical protein